ncbi:MAG: hypothetical protein DELT_02566 [Desulfovibrio sp.]
MKKTLFILLAVTLFPAQAWAAGCGCGSVRTIVAMAKTETIQAVNAHTAAEAASIRSEILIAAQNIIGTIKTESATIVRAILALKESNAAAIKGQAVAGQAMKTEDMYGKSAQPGGLCGASSVGAGIQLSAQAGRKVHEAMREKQLAYSNKPGAKPVEFLHRVLEPDHPSEREVVDALFPLEHTLSEDQVPQAHESIKTLANPRPMPLVTEAQQKTPAGQTYAAARKIHESRLASVMETLNGHVVRHAPTLPDDVTSWAKNQWEEAGGSGNPPGIVGGKLSEAGLYTLLSQMRVGNPNWFTQVASATDAGLLRELVIMQAFQFEQTRKSVELLDRIAFIGALDYLTRLEGTTGKDMDDLYIRMVGAQQ